ncbi:PREDICTED: SPATS2-like protein isoform X2 [Crocodylus porosus]|uniref:Spermatosis associated serine rich 2 like n=1 Tax=Crocodylus porosus TaxID=8502 RepID=A0A7M4EPX7_CROPO|nr:PREDICTED: SPATS2-like protein isoform X2 [Crocodylus porosus]
MAEVSSANIKEKISAVRSVVPNKSNNEIVLVLQQFDNNVDKAVQAFMDGSAAQVLKEWNMTGKKKNNKRKRSKSKQYQGNKDAKDKDDGTEKVSLEPHGIYGCHLNGCDKDNSSSDSANEKSEVMSHEDKNPGFADVMQMHPEITDKGLEHKRVGVDLNHKSINGTEQCDTFQSSVQPHHNLGRPKSKASIVKSSNPAAHLEKKADDSIKKRGPNIEKSVKDLQRCTVSLTRYRLMIKEEVDNSVKKIKAAFADLHSCIIDKEVSLMAEIDKVKEEAMEILNARQKKAEELKRLTDLASQMAEAQLSELRAEIKHFVSERKYDEELGRSARFTCDIEQLKTQIQQCGEISHPKNNYSSRTPCSSVLSSVTSNLSAGKQNTHPRKACSNMKNSESKTGSTKMPIYVPSNPTEPTTQVVPMNKQNGPFIQRRRFNPQHQSFRLNGSGKSQSTNETDQNNTKSGSRSEHRRQQHNNFRPKNKGATKNQDQSAATGTTEHLTHSEKTRRKHHTPDSTEPRSFRNSVARVSQCNLCPARIEVSADSTVLSVPAVTLVA